MVLQSHNTTKGFTLIEMLVALSLFTIVITIAVGSFLSLIGASASVQSEQSVMTTLTFALDSMTREIRTGTYYYCNSGTFSSQETLATSSLNCNSGTGLSFVEAGSSVSGSDSRIAYYYDSAAGTIYRRIGNRAPQSIVSGGVAITDAKFTVTGSRKMGPAVSDVNQPTVTIVLKARDEVGATTTLQTTITQRELDL